MNHFQHKPYACGFCSRFKLLKVELKFNFVVTIWLRSILFCSNRNLFFSSEAIFFLLLYWCSSIKLKLYYNLVATNGLSAYNTLLYSYFHKRQINCYSHIYTHSKLNFAITIINRKECFTWHREGDRVK